MLGTHHIFVDASPWCFLYIFPHIIAVLRHSSKFFKRVTKNNSASYFFKTFLRPSVHSPLLPLLAVNLRPSPSRGHLPHLLLAVNLTPPHPAEILHPTSPLPTLRSSSTPSSGYWCFKGSGVKRGGGDEGDEGESGDRRRETRYRVWGLVWCVVAGGGWGVGCDEWLCAVLQSRSLLEPEHLVGAGATLDKTEENLNEILFVCSNID